ncbi:MAG: hypothetical protein WCG05_01815 [Alphaproteobacteria bacterium]
MILSVCKIMKKILLRTVIALSFLGLALIAFVFMHAFFVGDLSKAPLQQEITEPLYLVSYADGHEVFHKNQKMLTYSALKKGVSYIFNYKRHLIDPVFVKSHQRIFDHKSGAGAWLWKPWVIMNTMKQAPENAYILYCDSGFMIKGNLSPLLELLKTHDVILAEYNREIFGFLGNRIKLEALIKANCQTKPCQESRLIWAGFLLVKNTPTGRKFIQQWLDYCSDEDMILPDSKLGGRHMYDQSLLSLTYAKNPQGVVLVDAEGVGHNNILKWHHRKSDEFVNHSLMLKLDLGLRGWERKIIDSWVIRKIANWVENP